MPERIAFITGGGGGLGGATVRLLAERGWRVFAADSDEAALASVAREARVTPVPVDVTDAASVESARATVSAAVPGLDGVVNFAGILAVGSLLEMEESALARVLEVNVLGTFRVNRAFFPLVLARRGRIVNVSSETGWQSAMPFNGAYAMSKHAVEAYSDALRREAMFLGIPVVKIQPGPFATGMVASIERNFTEAAARSRYFREVIEKLMHLAVGEQEKAHDPLLVARAVHEALTAPRPKIRYSVKPDRGRSLLSALPDRVADAALRRALRR